ncbi:uncharacterized protein LOC132282472 isoform X2 [Cornus florida]|uniref:uncharacterized protein LOC132282472 isoform X2 n=1 Tax=Cornus florida TaxID=4283 RepID=UPI002897DE10|nr:uncharacterized protein LOC132282472 isoform X2 [Cornus florida]
MSNEQRKVSHRDIQLVQNLIERCLQLYMSQKEVVDTLSIEAKIKPELTEAVWQRLEVENLEFFKAYHLRLIVKEQIVEYNKLLARQVELMDQICPTGAASLSMSNGTHFPMHQNSTCYVPEPTGHVLKLENMHHPIGTSLPNAFTNGGSSLNLCMQPAVDMSAHARRIDVSRNMLAQSSNVGTIQEMNGGLIKSESGYAGNSPFMSDDDGNVLETCPAIANAPVSSFGSVQSNSQHLNGTLLDADTSFGFFGPIHPNFGPSDFTEFSNSSDMLESYSRSAYLATDTDNFINLHGRGEHQGPTAPH